MKFRSRHIKSQFVLQIVFFVLYSFAVSVIVFLTYTHIEKKRNTEFLIIHLKHSLSHSYTTYCNFMLTVNKDDQFFSTGKNSFTTQFYITLEGISDTLNFAGVNNLTGTGSRQHAIKDSVISNIEKYKNNFNYITLAILERGVKGFGNLQSLCDVSDKILQHFSVSKNPEFFIEGIKLKGLESDFIYNYDLRVYNDLLSLLDEISASPSIQNNPNPDNQDLGALISVYRTKIHYQNNIALRLGLDNTEKGLVADFEHSYKDLKNIYNKYEASQDTLIQHSILEWKIGAITIFILLTLAIIFLFWKLLVRIRLPLLQTLEFSTHLSKGKLPAENLPTEGQFEFSILNNSLNRIKASVKDKQIFIESLLKQKFEIDLSLQGKNDTFGKTLLALKENMRKARDEQMKYAEEYRLRRYRNEGIAKFSEILRSNSDSMQNLADVFIRELVRYLEALQGGLFLTNEQNEQELHLAAAFAFDRKKYLQKTIAPGEGLVGACALEMKSINLTEIPADYLEITSGLGDIPPNNLLLMPVMNEGTLMGVIEIASLNKFEPHQIEVGEIIASSLASTIIAGRINTRTSELLGKSQQQAAEMAEQEEEMRQNLEELKATQEESARREEEMEGIINALSHSFCLLEYDITGTITKVNQKVLSLLSQPSESVVGKSHTEIFGKGSKADSILFTKVMDGSTIELVEKVKINNKAVELSNTFLPIHSKTGKTVKIINIMSINF
jgi:PAS domain-containing protein